MLTPELIAAAPVPARLGAPGSKLSDTGPGAVSGLHVAILPTGRRIWRLRVRSGGKDTVSTLGEFPALDLTGARAKATQDQATTPATPTGATFGPLADELVEHAIRSGKSKSTIKQLRWIRGHLAELDKEPIDAITTPRMHDLLKAFAAKNARSVGKVRSFASGVFKAAALRGLTERNPAAACNGSKELQGPGTREQRAITTPAGFGALLKAIKGYRNGAVKDAMRFILLTGARHAEVRQMRWKDVDLKEKLWRVEVGSMKKRREHLVPLSSTAIKLLERVAFDSADYVFSVNGSRPVSAAAFAEMLKAIGYWDQHVTHGFRSSMVSLMLDKGWDRQLMLLCISHKSPGVGGRYDRAERLQERREALQAWAEYVNELVN